MKIRREFSAGGVVYRRVDERLLVLVGKHSGYHKWVLPKGLIEEGETKMEAAVREVEEETGIRAKVVDREPIFVEKYKYRADYKQEDKSKSGDGNDGGDLRRVEKYQEEGGDGVLVEKEVVFFLMEYVSGDVRDHSWEMEEVVWLEYEEAWGRLDFEGERLALKKVGERLQYG